MATTFNPATWTPTPAQIEEMRDRAFRKLDEDFELGNLTQAQRAQQEAVIEEVYPYATDPYKH